MSFYLIIRHWKSIPCLSESKIDQAPKSSVYGHLLLCNTYRQVLSKAVWASIRKWVVSRLLEARVLDVRVFVAVGHPLPWLWLIAHTLQLGLRGPNDWLQLSILVIQLQRLRVRNRATRLQIWARNYLFDRNFYLLAIHRILYNVWMSQKVQSLPP